MIASLTWILVGTVLGGDTPRSTAPTYSHDVAPILQRRCQSCHRPGQVGPFSFLSFDDARGRAQMIARVLDLGVMPPWNADARFDGVFVNQRSLMPHMHTRGKDMSIRAHFPDGKEQELLFAHYDFNWQEAYILPDPMPLPAGTKLECIGHFDNSAANPNNPDPKAAVRWGDQTFEEMMVGYIDTVVPLE